MALALVSCSKNKTEGFGAPHNLSATDGSYVDRVQISWDSVNGAELYLIFRSQTVDGNYVKIGSVSGGTVFNDYDAVPQGTVFYYKTSAWSSADGDSGYSNDDSGKIGSASSLTAPTISVISAATQINISWNAVPGATRYYIYRKGTSDPDYAPLNMVTSLTYADTTAVQGLTYDYKVRAWSAGGYSDYSTFLSGQIGATLAAPVAVTASSNSSSKITISWMYLPPVPGVAFKVWRAASINGEYVAVDTVSSSPFDDDVDKGLSTDLIQGKYYYYKIQAVLSGQTSPMSSPYATGKALPALSPPVINAASGAGSINLSWSAVSGASDYDIYRSDNGGASYSPVPIGSTSSAAYSDTPPSPNIMYYYKIKARNSDGTSVYSNIAVGYGTAANGAPLPPSGLGATIGSNSITLNWIAPASTVTGYRVYRSSDGSTYSLIGTSAVTSFINSGTSPLGWETENGKNYYYRVSAINGSDEGLGCAAVTAVIPVTLPAPVFTISGAGITSDSVTLTSISGIGTLYYIYRSVTSSGPYTMIGNTTGSSFIDTALNPLTTYYYVVSAYSEAGGYSPLSIEHSGTTLAIHGTPTISSITKRSLSTDLPDRIQMTWTSTVGSKYYLYRSDSTSGSYTMIKEFPSVSVTSVTYDDQSVEIGKDYYYQLQVYSPANGYSARSAAVMGNTSTSLIMPANVSASDGSVGGDDAHINITCNTVVDATVYYVYRSTSAAAGAVFEYVGNIAAPSTNWDDLTSSSSPPAFGTRHYYRIVAYDAAGKRYSPLSDIDDVNPELDPAVGFLQNPPIAVTASDGTSGNASPDSQIVITWGSVAYGAEYDIYCSTNGGTSYTYVATQTAGPYAHSYGSTQNVNGGKLFYYKIVSRSSSASLGVNYTNSTGDMATAPNDTGYLRLYHPAAVTASDGTVGSSTPKTVIALSWDAVANATGYSVYRDTSAVGTYSTLVGSFATNTGTDTTATNGNQYYYKVIASNGLGSGANSDLLSSAYDSGYLQYSTPTSVAATTSTSTTTQITVTWTGCFNADEYDVYRSTSPTGPFTGIVTTSSSPFTDGGVVAGTNYYYKVTAHRSIFTNDTSDVADCLVSSAGYLKLKAPVNVQASQGTSADVTVTWDDSNLAGVVDGYEIYRNDSTYSTIIGSSVTTTYTDTTVASGTNYTYKIVAKKLSQTGANSAQSAASTVGYSDFDPPTSLSAVTAAGTGGFSQINLSWTAPSGSSVTYEIWRGTSSGAETLLTTTASTSYSNTGCVNNGASSATTYYYYVKAYNASQSNSASGASNEADATLSVLGAPSLTATSTGSGVSLSWSAVTGADQYIVYRDGSLITTQSGTTYADTGMPYRGKNCSYYVVAKLSSGAGAHSGSQSTAYPRMWNLPSGFAVTAVNSSGTDINVTWNNTTIKAQTYSVNFSINGGSTWNLAASALTGGSYTYTAFAGNTYVIRVTAVSDDETTDSVNSSSFTF